MARSRQNRPAGGRPRQPGSQAGSGPVEPTTGAAAAAEPASTPEAAAALGPEALPETVGPEGPRDETPSSGERPLSKPAGGRSEPVLARAGAPVAATPAGGTSDGRTVLVGAIGGLVAAALLIGVLYYAGWLGRPGEDVGERVAALESEAVTVRALAPRVDEAAGGVTALGERLGAVESGLAELQQQVQELAGRPPSEGGPAVDLSALEGGQRDLQGAVTALQAELGEQRQQLDGQRQQLEASLNGLRENLGGVTSGVEGLKQEVTELRAQQPDLAPLTQRLDAVDQAVAAERSRSDELAQQLAAAQQSVAAVGAAFREELQAVKAAATQAQAMALALAQLDAAIDAGAPIGPALDQLAPLGTDDPAIAGALDTLGGFREGGVPTRASLRARLDELETAIVTASEPPPARDWVGRVRQNLTGLVSVREAGPAETTTGLAIGGARTALDQDNVAAAAQALRPLADSGNEAARAWIADAQERIEAEAALAALRARLEAVLALVR